MGFRICLRFRVMQQGVINREAIAQALAVWQPHGGKSLGDGTQPQAFRGRLFLAFDVGRAHNQGQTRQARCAEFVVFNDRFKGAPLAAMIQLHLRQSRRVKRNCPRLSRFQQLFFGDEKEFRVGVDKLADQPRTRHTIYLYVLARDPFHTPPR